MKLARFLKSWGQGIRTIVLGLGSVGIGTMAIGIMSMGVTAPDVSPPERSTSQSPTPTPNPVNPNGLPYLPWVASPLRPVVNPDLGLDPQIWGQQGFQRDWADLMRSVNHSLTYLRSAKAEADYAQLQTGLGDPTAIVFSHDRVLRSVERFRQILLTADSPEDLRQQVQADFELYQATGNDGAGTVHFTGYFEPTYSASRTPNDRYRYPLYRRPADFATWATPHPTRLNLEGADGLQGHHGGLKGLELVWLADRLEAYLVQVQGSARLALTDGSVMSVGYDGHTNYPYVSIGKALVADGHFRAEELTLPKVLQYFETHPSDLDRYLPQNDRFVFFRETSGAAATGSIGVPVTPERSIATDKSLMPPGAIVLMVLDLPYAQNLGEYTQRSVQRFGVDQDTGGAIRGTGRADIFMGTGTTAGDRAGLVNSNGQLYYLLLK